MTRERGESSATAWRSRILSVLILLALTWGMGQAYALRWTTDDAYISFRYAANLVGGHGLVYNEGERVEGYTNPLWTLWIAMGLAAGFDAAHWANFWSLLCYGGSIALLGFHALHGARRAPPRSVVPAAALGAALHREWNVFATGGLETSAFTFLLLAGFTVAVGSRSRPGAHVAAGALLGLAALTRHDGLLAVLVVGSCVAAWDRPGWKAAARFGAGFAVLWVPFTLWRLSYYGGFFPNTYYAKSAYLAWYGQGLRYLQLYLEKYWIVLLGPLLLLVAWCLPGGRSRSPDERDPREARLALAAGALAVVYVAYVTRVGGDFMFARMLIPVTPLLLLLFELGSARVFRSRPTLGSASVLVALAAMVWTPTPARGTEYRYGVADERAHYEDEAEAQDSMARVLRPYFEGLPVRVAIFGGEARIAHEAGFHVAIECASGLTEPAVARQEIGERGRPGHEKYPSAVYLIEQRKAHFSFGKAPVEQLRLNAYIPRVYARFGADVFGQVLHWDPALMAALRQRGAVFPDIDEVLRVALSGLPERPVEQRRRVFERLDRFYFRHVEDPEREAAFRDLLH